MNPLLPPALAELGLIIYRDVKSGNSKKQPIPYFPVPNQIVSVAIIYGVLGVLPDRFSRISALFGWGVVIATALNVFNPATVGNVVRNAALPSSKK